MAHTIRLKARTLEPVYPESVPGGLLQSFSKQEVMKNNGYEHFCFCLKLMTEIGRGYNLGSGKQLLAIKVSFCINKPGFQGLMSELATHSLLRRLTFMTSYL